MQSPMGRYTLYFTLLKRWLLYRSLYKIVIQSIKVIDDTLQTQAQSGLVEVLQKTIIIRNNILAPVKEYFLFSFPLKLLMSWLRSNYYNLPWGKEKSILEHSLVVFTYSFKAQSPEHFIPEEPLLFMCGNSKVFDSAPIYIHIVNAKQFVDRQNEWKRTLIQWS